MERSTYKLEDYAIPKASDNEILIEKTPTVPWWEQNGQTCSVLVKRGLAILFPP